MKVYKLTVMIIDRDRIGIESAANELECGRFGNRCISPRVISASEADAGEWSDEHPLNYRQTYKAEFERLFEEVK